MKILNKNLKENEIKIQIECLEDIWHLYHVIEKNDLITAKTFRKTSIKTSEGYDYGEKRPMILTIKVEKIELKKDSGILRLTGPIIEGPEDAAKQAYHSLEIEVNSIVTIKKERWKTHQTQRLEKAKVKKARVLVCIVDREEADFAILSEAGIEMKAKIENKDKENMENFYEKIIDYLKQQTYDFLVLAGPGFERENLFKYINERYKHFAHKIILEHTSATGINGIHELLKKSANRILKETRIAKESEYVSELLKRIACDGLVVYGKNETKKAIELGAVETLLISQEKVNEFEDLMEMEEKMGGKIVIIGSDHELGEQFLHLGGIAGFLRFRIH